MTDKIIGKANLDLWLKRAAMGAVALGMLGVTACAGSGGGVYYGDGGYYGGGYTGVYYSDSYRP